MPELGAVPPTPQIVVASTPTEIATPSRQVAAAVDAFMKQQGGAVTWNSSRTVGTVTENTPQANVTLAFKLQGAGSGKTNLTVEVTFESALLDVLPAGLIEGQLEQSVNQLAQVVSHLALRVNGPNAGELGAA